MQDFRRLHVWRRAHEFAVDVRRAVGTFPPRGYADLRSQLTRAAESIKMLTALRRTVLRSIEQATCQSPPRPGAVSTHANPEEHGT